MAREKRHYIPGQIWHLTHRYHKREFWLKLVKDRKRYKETIEELMAIRDYARHTQWTKSIAVESESFTETMF